MQDSSYAEFRVWLACPQHHAQRVTSMQGTSYVDRQGGYNCSRGERGQGGCTCALWAHALWSCGGMLAQNSSSSASVENSTSSCTHRREHEPLTHSHRMQSGHAACVVCLTCRERAYELLLVSAAATVMSSGCTSRRDSGTPTAPLSMCTLSERPAWLPMFCTHSLNSATASNLTPYFISIHHRALMLACTATPADRLCLQL